MCLLEPLNMHFNNLILHVFDDQSLNENVPTLQRNITGREGPVQGLREGLPPLRILLHLPGEDLPRGEDQRLGPLDLVILIECQFCTVT